MNGIETEHQSDFADGVLVFADHLAALFQLQLVDVFFGRHVHIFLEKNLQGRTGHGELLADLRNGDGLVDSFVDVSENLFQKLIFIMLPGCRYGLLRLLTDKFRLKQTDDRQSIRLVM